MSMARWLYDFRKSYQDNYDLGPSYNGADTKLNLENFSIFGKTFGSRIVLSSGPLLNYKFIVAAIENGFVPVYKTVRTCEKECLKFPNIVEVDSSKQINAKDKDDSITTSDIENSSQESSKTSITNSFGMPSQDPKEWMEDVKKCQEYAKKHNTNVIYSFVGSGDTIEEMKNDYAKCAQLLIDAGAEIIEANFSCPNVKTENGALYLSPENAEDVLKEVRKKVGNEIILGIKVGVYKDTKELENFLSKNAKYINYISGINTVSKKVVNKDGKSALKDRGTSGICGYAITEAGEEFLMQTLEVKNKLNLKNLVVISGGGVMTPQNAEKRFRLGADFIGTATAAMCNQNFAKECYENCEFLKHNKLK